MIKINVVVDSPKWKKKIKNIKNYFKLKQRKFNTNCNSSKSVKEFTVFLTSNYRMKNLNNKFRKVNKPTDVLSFPLNIKFKKKIYLGDIAISYEIINKRSKEILGHLNEISIIDFDHTDVVRHPLVSKIVKAYSDQNFKK